MTGVQTCALPIFDATNLTVTLMLTSATTSSDNITASYTASGSNKIQDIAGNLLTNLTSLAVINNNSDTTQPAAPTLALNAASDSGTSNSDANTNVTTPSVRVTLNGTGVTAPLVGNTVNVYSGASVIGTATLSSTNINDGYIDITTSTLGSRKCRSWDIKTRACFIKG